MDCEVKSFPKGPNSGTKVDLKICGVCGDRALGYNFNAVTCESCKAFFRRNALKNKEFRCPFNDSCEISMVTRRFCQRCRLEKCLSIGMRKDYIMSEEDKNIKKQKIEQNRARKRPSAEHSNLKHEDDSNYDVYDPGVLVITNSETLEPPPPQKVWISNPLNESYEDIHKLDSYEPFKEMSVINSKLLTSEPLPSPTGGASVPSPSSPTDSATIAASRTVEMVSDRETSSAAVSVITSPPSTKHLYKNETPLLSSLINNPRTDEASSDSSDHSSTAGFNKREETASYKATDSCWSDNDLTSSSSNYLSTKDTAKEILQDIQQHTQRIPHTPTSIESILSEAIKLEFEAYSSLAQSHSHHHNSRELNDAERAKLNELIVANKALHDPLDHDLSTLIGDDCKFKANADNSSPMLLDVINLTAIAIRRLIKTSKKINAFKNMCQEDQVALLKGGCTEMLILRSAMTYDPDKNSWSIPHSQDQLNVKVDVLKEARGNIYEEHQRFLRTFEPMWRMDENIMLILSAITLFTPDRAHVIHHDVIRLEQNSYYYLLRRYLESIYQGCEARSTFLKLIQKIAELHRLNDEHVKVYLDVNPRDVEPLLIEIFDLNSASLRPDKNS